MTRQMGQTRPLLVARWRYQGRCATAATVSAATQDTVRATRGDLFDVARTLRVMNDSSRQDRRRRRDVVRHQAPCSLFLSAMKADGQRRVNIEHRPFTVPFHTHIHNSSSTPTLPLRFRVSAPSGLHRRRNPAVAPASVATTSVAPTIARTIPNARRRGVEATRGRVKRCACSLATSSIPRRRPPPRASRGPSG